MARVVTRLDSRHALPNVGQRWRHRTTNPAHQDYGRVVTIVAAGPSHVSVRGKHVSHWPLANFLQHYHYLDHPEETMTVNPFEGEQLALDIGPFVTPEKIPNQTIQQAFEAFHRANPWVYAAFVRLTRDWLDRGHAKVGIGMLTEVIRWQYGRQTDSTDGFKINNNHRSRYVRLILEQHPEWADVFETRELTAA